MPNETKFRRDYIKAANKLYHSQPVENVVVEGMADTYNVYNGFVFWIELKHLGSDRKRVKFEHGQVPWLTKQDKLLVDCFVVVKCGNGLKVTYSCFTTEDLDELCSVQFFNAPAPLFKTEGKGALQNIVQKIHDYLEFTAFH